MNPSVTTIDCHYMGHPGFAAAFLLCEPDSAAFVETNTSRALPHLLGALERAGRRPEDVELIIITHVHLDHAGGASALMRACPNATLLAHPKAAAHIIAPEKLVASARQVYGDEAFDKIYGEIEPIAEARVRVMKDGESVTLGGRSLRFFYTQGHANHHFCIHDSASNGVFTGDSFGIAYPALQTRGRFVFPTTTPTDFDAAMYQESLRKVVATGAERVFLTHFGEHGDVEAVASDLHTQLDAYGALVAEADASGREGDALEVFCKARVAAFFDEGLKAHGVGSDPKVREMLAVDIDLNGQGVAFAVKKRRFKRPASA